MNRNVMNRQMFAKGGAAFPDLSGDGQVTQRDILMGRGVQFKQDGGRVMTEEEKIQRALENERFRQEMGLDRMPTAEDLERIERMRIEQLTDEERRFLQTERMRGIKRYQEGGTVPPMDPAMMAPPMDPAIQEGIAGQLDPAILEPLLAEAATRFGSIDEASDYEDLINRVRGDRAPLEARRDELAMFVGEADAAQTPDSVLAMVQPVIQMSGVDQGIGGLAQQAMDVPVEGPMAEGIMSMVAANEPMPAEMPMGMDQGMGGPAPVNFNQGGAVRRGDDEPVQYYQEAGVVMTPEQEALLAQGAQQGYQYAISQLPEIPSLEDAFGQRQERYRNLLGGSEEQKNLTKAQMLFDIANLGLGFAGGAGAVRPGMSPAEQLAASAVKLQTLPTISQRAGSQLEQQQKVDLAAMTAAEKDLDRRIAARAEIQKANIKAQTDLLEKQMELQKGVKTDRLRLVNTETGAEIGTFNLSNPAEKDLYNSVKADLDNKGILFNTYTVGTEPAPSDKVIDYITNSARLKAYAAGTLDDKQKTKFEQLILDKFKPKNRRYFDTETSKFLLLPPEELAPAIMEALKKGNPNLYRTVLRLQGSGQTTAQTAGQTTAQTTAQTAGQTTAQTTAQTAPAPVKLSDAAIEIMNPDGTVNLNSPVWELSEPNAFDPKLDYGAVIGFSRLMPGFTTTVSEIYAEMGGDSTPAAENFRLAQKSLSNLANDLLQFRTNLSDERVLKFVQERIEKEVENIRPGGTFIRTDANAYASLQALRESFTRAMQIEAAKVPEYGGDASGYTEAQVTKARSLMNQMKVLLNDILAFEKAFKAGFSSKAVPETLNNQSAENLKSQINQLRKEQ